MIVIHNGRKIVALPKRKDGFPGVLVRVNGVQVWHYGPRDSSQCRTVEGAIEYTKREIDSNWYAATDPRRAIALSLGR